MHKILVIVLVFLLFFLAIGFLSNVLFTSKQEIVKLSPSQTANSKTAANPSVIPSVCGIKIIKTFGFDAGLHVTYIEINYNSIYYYFGDYEKTSFNYNFKGGFEPAILINRIAFNTDNQKGGDINGRPESGYFDLVFYSQKISRSNFDEISNCIKSNIDSVRKFLKANNYRQGILRGLIYTNRDPYVTDYYVCNNSQLLTLQKPSGQIMPSLRGNKIDFLIGELKDGSAGSFGYIINGKFYPDLITSGGPVTQLSDTDISFAKSSFETIAKCRNASGQTIKYSNSLDDFIKNPEP